MATYRKYRTVKGAARYVAKLEAQLGDMNRKRIEAGKGLSGVDFYRVGDDPQGFGFVVLAVMVDGKQYLCS